MAQDDIQGQVVDPSGNPVSGAIVELTKSFESNPVEEQTVLRTTTDSNGNYIFEFHPDGDGTTQDYHVSCYNHDGTAYVNSFNNPGVTADLPSNAIPDSVLVQSGGEFIVDEVVDSEAFTQDPLDFGNNNQGVGVDVAPIQAGTDRTIPINTSSDIPSGADGESIELDYSGQFNEDVMYVLVKVDFDTVNQVVWNHKQPDFNKYIIGYFDTTDVSNSGYTNIERADTTAGSWEQVTNDFSSVSGTQYLAFGTNHSDPGPQYFHGVQLNE